MSYPKIYLYKRIVQAKLFIDEYFREAINVEDIAEEAHFSKFHFIRLFKRTYGYTPRQYLIHKRIEFAQIRLRDYHSVTDTCFDSGFSSLGTFSTLFKEKTGLSPSQFRDQHRKTQLAMQATPQKYIPGCFLGKSNFQ